MPTTILAVAPSLWGLTSLSPSCYKPASTMSDAQGMNDAAIDHRTSEEIRLSKKDRKKRKRVAKAARVKAERVIRKKKQSDNASKMAHVSCVVTGRAGTEKVASNEHLQRTEACDEKGNAREDEKRRGGESDAHAVEGSVPDAGEEKQKKRDERREAKLLRKAKKEAKRKSKQGPCAKAL